MSLRACIPTRSMLFLIFTIASISLTAQNFENLAKNHIVSNPKDFSINVTAASKLLVVNKHTTAASKLTHVYMNQTHNGMKIYNAIANVTLDENGEVFHAGNRLVNHAKIQNANPSLSAPQAVSNVASFFGQSIAGQTNIMSTANGAGQRTILENSSIANSDIIGELMYVNQNGTLVLTWSIAYMKSDDNFWWDTKVNAMDGSIVEQTSWTVECKVDHGDEAHDHDNHDHSFTNPKENKSVSKKSAKSSAVINGDYTVYAMPDESPNHGPLSVVNSPWNNVLDLAANPFTATPGASWHNDGTATHFTTRGNNVWAVEDIDTDNDQSAGFSPASQLGVTGQQYNFLPDFTMPPAAYQEAAITNLFYWNNITHDVLYHYDFNEECGNFQETNGTGLGLGDDSVNADAMDGDMVVGPNNANFGTPPDGQNPRMQMFPFTAPAVVMDPVFSGNVSLTTSGVPEIYAGIQWTAANDGALVLVTDSGGTSEACGAPAPGSITNGAAIAGNVALIDRGSCNFTEKVENAEASGAISVVICNNIAGSPSTMGGTPANPITIPAFMISQASCNTIKANLPGVSVSFATNPQIRTSDYDNGIIVHEYAHGWSTRLTGGAANSGCLSGDDQMGEGWSDFLGIVLTMKPGDTGPMPRPVGTYAVGQPTNGGGIRPAPYSTDFAVNSLTYGETAAGTLSIPHGVGTVWATMLWDMTWDLIGIYGFGTNIYESNIGNPGFGGQNLSLRLVTEALKLQPCNPGFVDGRDAILAADQALYGGIHNCLIWNAFATRGLGVSAEQGSFIVNTDNVEAFDLPDVDIEKTASSALTTDGTSVTWDLLVNVSECANGQGGVTVTDNVDPNLIITSVVCPTPAVASTTGNAITITHPGFGAGSGTFTCNVITTVNTGTTAQPSQFFIDDVESGNAGWTINEITGAGAGPWAIVNTASNSPANSWFIDNTNGPDKTVALESPVFALGPNPSLKFFHQFDTEGGWDGGYVEVSTDGGATWTQIGASDFILNGYNSVLGINTNTDIAGKDAWSGNSGGFIETIAHLGSFANSDVSIRFIFGQDDNTNSVGWWVDDIEITNDQYTIIENIACVVRDSGGDTACSTASTCVEIVACLPGALGLSVVGNDATCATGVDGTATVSATGGLAPYTYLWSNNQTSATATNLAAGTYSVTVTDANACAETVNVTIGALPGVCPLDPSIPTMGEWGLMSLCLLLLIFGVVRIKESEQALATVKIK